MNGVPEEKVMVKNISHEKWSAMLDRITNNGRPLIGWYPTMEDAKELSKDPVENYEFIIWILYSNDSLDLMEDELKVEEYLELLLNEHTEFTES